jgi:hypothetical protein
MYVLAAGIFAALSIGFMLYQVRKFYKHEVPLDRLNEEYFELLDKERQRG